MKNIFLTLVFAFGLSSCETTNSGGPTVTESSQTAEAAPTREVAPTPAGPKPYPRSTCLVTGEKLDSQGTPMTFTHKGQEVKVCCAACKMAFNMSPGTYLAKIP